MKKDTEKLLLYGGVAFAAYYFFLKPKAVYTPVQNYSTAPNTTYIPQGTTTVNTVSNLLTGIENIFKSGNTTGPDGSVLTAVDPGVDIQPDDPDYPSYLVTVALT